MAELKTIKTDASVAAFIDAIDDEARREDCRTIVKIMRQATKAEPKMWGPSIVGFGDYHYKYASGREGDSFVAGFSPRKKDLTLYIMPGFDGHDALLAKVGKYKTGKSCLYIRRLSQVDIAVLKELVSRSVRYMKKRYG